MTHKLVHAEVDKFEKDNFLQKLFILEWQRARIRLLLKVLFNNQIFLHPEREDPHGVKAISVYGRSKRFEAQSYSNRRLLELKVSRANNLRLLGKRSQKELT